MKLRLLKAAGSYAKQRYMLIIWSVWIVLLTELFSRRAAGDTFGWSAAHLAGFALNALIVLSLIFLFTALIGRARPAYWVVTGLALALSLVSGIKFKMLGVPLLPWDFVLTGEGADMAQYLKNIVTLALAAGLVIFAAGSVWLLYKAPHRPVKAGWKERGILVVAALFCLSVLYFNKPLPLKSWTHTQNIAWDQAENVKTNGFLLTMLMNVQQAFIGKPAGFDEEAVAAFAAANTPAPSATAAPAVKPNIIVVLSESFFDATKIPNLTFSKDPLPFFHKIQQEYTSGTFLSPQFGGGTANVEYEVLTGNSMRFLPQGSIPYNQYINRGVDSLASIMTRQGYTATAISPFYDWFFNARSVYQDFGFGKFISLEYFDPVYTGPYIADSETAKNIIAASDQSSGPDFIFANTMENHFHYYPGKFKENTIKVGGVAPRSEGFFETYAQGLIDADKMLQTLVEHYTASKEPTIILFFGDHLPVLGDDYQAYKDAGYIKSNDDPDFLTKIYQTPFVVWNNFLPAGQKDQLYMSPSFISPYLLKLAGMPGSYYTDFLAAQYKKTPVIPPKNYYAQMGIADKDLQQYQALQYDIMFGGQEGYNAIKGKIVNPDYHLGFGAIRLDRITPDKVIAGGADATITAEGSYLPALCVLYWNDKALETKWTDGKLTAKVPADLLKAGTAQVTAKLSDSKGTVLGESNAVQVTINGQ